MKNFLYFLLAGAASAQTTQAAIAFPKVTACAAAVLAILQMLLMAAVSAQRLKTGTTIGDGGDEALTRAVRRHGNLSENSPIFLIVIGLLEMSGAQPTVVFGLAVLFVVGRFCHAAAFSLTSGPHPLRALGFLSTFLSTLSAGAYLLIRSGL